MKNYRVKSVNSTQFIVQKRYWLFFWYTYGERRGMLHTNKFFNSKEDALLYAKEKKSDDIRYKAEKYIEYL